MWLAGRRSVGGRWHACDELRGAGIGGRGDPFRSVETMNSLFMGTITFHRFMAGIHQYIRPLISSH